MGAQCFTGKLFGTSTCDQNINKPKMAFRRNLSTRWTCFKVKFVFEYDFEISWSLGTWDHWSFGHWDHRTFDNNGGDSLGWTIKDNHGLPRTMMDYLRLSWTIMDSWSYIDKKSYKLIL